MYILYIIQFCHNNIIPDENDKHNDDDPSLIYSYTNKVFTISMIINSRILFWKPKRIKSNINNM